MATAILQAIGGVGVFLLGMLVMTEGLRAVAGDSLRRFLARFTRSPATGVVTGAVTTAAIQSSTATTVAVVGFVGAGLLTFTQAVGIIFGANIGTTFTGWLVALVGLKLQLSAVLMPLILVGALMRIFARGTPASLGQALAGFGLIFVGIDTLQGGMAGLEGMLTPETFPPDGLGARLVLVGLGALLTIITQSSSAGVATALAAVHAGTIELAQAAALVIGMDIGTTVTAALAAAGGSTAARRTAAAHVVYNLFTGTLAFVMLSPYIAAWTAAAPGMVSDDPELVLVAFHTTFNLLSVALILPFTARFSAMIIRMVKGGRSDLTQLLERSLLDDPAVAISALRVTLASLLRRTAERIDALLNDEDVEHLGEREFEDEEGALIDARTYASQLNSAHARKRTRERHAAVLHAIDHLDRLIDRVRKSDRIATVRASEHLGELLEPLAPWIQQIGLGARLPRASELEQQWRKLVEAERSYRAQTLDRLAVDNLDAGDAIARLDAIRWLRRVAHHLYRILLHLEHSHLHGAPPLIAHRAADERDED